MATPLATKRLSRELNALLKTPLTHPKILALPNESNILEWHYLLEGPSSNPSDKNYDPNSPYRDGIYHGKLIFPKEYPYKPPSVMILTPNGRFKPNRRLCLSMSDFHPETWNPMWSISTILTGLYSFMMGKDKTLGSIETSDAQKRQFAKDSLMYNVEKCGERKIFAALYPEYVKLHEERKREEEERRRKEMEANGGSGDVTSGSGGEERVVVPSENHGLGEGNGVLALGAGIVALLSILFAIRFF